MKTEWDLSHLEKGKSFEEKREEIKMNTEKFVQKWRNRKDYLESPEVLKEALEEYEKWMEFWASSDEFYYFWLKSQQNQEDPDTKARYNKIEEFEKKISNEIMFFSLNVSKIPESSQKMFLQNEHLKKYKHLLERLFVAAKYTLSEKEERIMNLKATTSHSLWEKMTSEFLSREEKEILDEDGKIVKATLEKMKSLINSKNKNIRDEAARALNDVLKKNLDTAEAEINAILMDKKTNDELRGYERPDKARHVSDDIETEIVDNLIKTVTKRFTIAKDYYKLKARLLGETKLEYHERNVGYGKIDDKYSYEDSIKLIGKIFGNLDKKFEEVFNDFVETGLVDVYPKKGKLGGAFCMHGSKIQPVYLMLNHTDKLNDIMTFAHELGHGINYELIKEKQPAIYFGTSKATAEVASTFMEDFVLQELMKESNDELKLSLMVSKLGDDISTIIRQAACYNFEMELHEKFREKSFLQKEEIGRIFQKHMASYMGDYVEQSPGSDNWWVYWSHVRMFFYVYSYSSGLLISKALQRKVKENKNFIEKVKEFLSAGVSESPEEIFKEMGIILNEEFWNKGLDEVEDLLHEAENLAKKLGKI